MLLPCLNSIVWLITDLKVLKIFRVFSAFRTALIRPGDRQGPGHIEITLATLYDVFSDPGALETVKANMLK